MPPKPYSLMGIFLIMGIAGCISSTVSAAMRPEDLDAQLADLRAPLHHFRDKLNPQANALALALSLSLFLSEGLKQGQTPCPGASLSLPLFFLLPSARVESARRTRA